ncbi:zinc finger and BTB domain-containing protein 41-like isoform X4 [Physella acuta]|uniref:zinc finger and BTB domain-containing protein 41-like isoform X4 n=1 Tax=Physella acuta TaxID=109671 RepID=UPI0027DE1083|nr:zinc finger and BTB domain-containing protein 41-like isoform X4 [Physella acuta]
MPEIQPMDVAVANRFITSLSKSLQALCHGCMDFDSGIEIIGYINVNIDSGSKVDYVLNEKVLKSTTNSMTFVSNSFLAKKEQNKHTRDGACSPVAELASPPPFQSRLRGTFHGSLPRSSVPFHQSYGIRGSQKRTAAMDRDWRISPKKHKGRPPFSSSLNEQSSTIQSSADANFKTPLSSETISGDGEVNIKKEVMESEGETVTFDSDQLNQNEEKSNSESLSAIKTDPDASGFTDGEAPASDDAIGDNQSDFKGTFLQPSSEEFASEQTEKQSGIQSEASTSDSFKHKSGHLSGSSADAHDDTAGENIASGSDMPADYDETGEEGAYPQSVYSDAGEGSSDTGQFEVIEIDDEDEDVQAMFAESRLFDSGHRRKHHNKQQFESSQILHGLTKEQEDLVYNTSLSDNFEQRLSQSCNVDICSICRIALPVGVTYQIHFNEVHASHHSAVDQFICNICYKGFVTKERLRQHSSVHAAVSYSCYICDVKFKHKKNIGRHLESTHGMKKCSYCMSLFKKGNDFDNHMLMCDAYKAISIT